MLRLLVVVTPPSFSSPLAIAANSLISVRFRRERNRVGLPHI